MPKKEVNTDVWVAVTPDVEVASSVAQYRHRVTRGYKMRDFATTACGSTGSPGAVWQRDRNKPKCPQCVTKSNTK
jgi:hypothetical protein